MASFGLGLAHKTAPAVLVFLVGDVGVERVVSAEVTPMFLDKFPFTKGV